MPDNTDPCIIGHRKFHISVSGNRCFVYTPSNGVYTKNTFCSRANNTDYYSFDMSTDVRPAEHPYCVFLLLDTSDAYDPKWFVTSDQSIYTNSKFRAIKLGYVSFESGEWVPSQLTSGNQIFDIETHCAVHGLVSATVLPGGKTAMLNDGSGRVVDLAFTPTDIYWGIVPDEGTEIDVEV